MYIPFSLRTSADAGCGAWHVARHGAANGTDLHAQKVKNPRNASEAAPTATAAGSTATAAVVAVLQDHFWYGLILKETGKKRSKNSSTQKGGRAAMVAGPISESQWLGRLLVGYRR